MCMWSGRSSSEHTSPSALHFSLSYLSCRGTERWSGMALGTGALWDHLIRQTLSLAQARSRKEELLLLVS
ncbi:hypothetical protein AOLI_G00122700 [Acnodon oligacanthus]